ncbi:EthD family reductase [Gordonia westfalica]|uniref:EthD family reductase n=1 Tax=Gordonia westfalica TaxID=158898 RepID=A0A1H2KX18_9ACTN|nr:EthD family reductase [Gordonia westfalica]MDS1113404.1 EthD family reductase [Gordonia westfalica]SDU73239.1 conserved hypothetical protein [Gordonia westfalica]
MHDVIVLYNHPEDPEAFDAHYTGTHIRLAEALPDLVEFAWGKTTAEGEQAPYYLVARMTYPDAETAGESFASPAGVASVEDLANFAGAGVTVLHVPRLAAGEPK